MSKVLILKDVLEVRESDPMSKEFLQVEGSDLMLKGFPTGRVIIRSTSNHWDCNYSILDS